jgi:VanZ family protein
MSRKTVVRQDFCDSPKSLPLQAQANRGDKNFQLPAICIQVLADAIGYSAGALVRGLAGMKFLRVLALLLLALLVVLTIVPANDRPVTGLQHDLEHIGAFLLPGLLLGLSLGWRTRSLLLAAIVYTLALECMQIFLPTRHARLQDFIVDSIAICAGIVVARLGMGFFRFQPRT